MTMEQVVTQLQQEVINLRAQVAAESGLADAVRAINNHATAQVRKDTPSLINVKGLGRPKEFKTEAIFAGVIKGPLNFRRKSRRQRLILSSCRRTLMRSAKPGVCAAADAHNTHGSHEWRSE